MAKYEIMLVVDGSLDNKAAQDAIAELVKLIDKTKNYKMQELGLKDLAYTINKQKKGWYFLYNFDCEQPEIISEFRRLVLINKAALRHLIINLEKDYGWKALNNPKKTKRTQIKAKKFVERQAKMKAEKEARDKARAEFAAIKADSNKVAGNE